MLASRWTKAWIMTWLGLQYCLLLNWCLKRTDRNSDIVGKGTTRYIRSLHVKKGCFLINGVRLASQRFRTAEVSSAFGGF